MRQLRENLFLTLVALALILGMVFLPPGIFDWRVFAQVYGVVTPEPPPQQFVPLTPSSPVLVLDSTPLVGDEAPPSAIILPSSAIEITPSGSRTRILRLLPAQIYNLFAADLRFQDVDVRFMRPSNRLIAEFSGNDHGDATLLIQVYVLYGVPGEEARFQINVYRAGVLIDDKTELYMGDDGSIVWLRRV